MKFFRKINIGAIVLLIVVISVAVYMVCMNSKHNKIEEEAESFITSFFEADADWATIPEEYRKDSKGYIKSIEKDVKKYFCDDSAYDYYIKYVILVQYNSNKFLNQNEHTFKKSDILSTSFDGKKIEVSMTVDMESISGEVKMTLIESNDGLKISSLNYPLEISENADNYQPW